MNPKTKQIRRILEQEKLDGLLISSSFNIRYLTGFDGFSTDEREGFALITASNLYIFADPRLSEGARKNSKGAVIIEFGAGRKLLPQVREIIQKEKLKIIGFEENLTYSEYKRFKKLRGIKLKMVEEIVEEVRSVKDKDELSSLQKACKLTDDAFSYVLKKLRTGVTEKEIAWELERYIREQGNQLAFGSIVAFGENSAVPHHKTTNRELRTNNIVLLDFGAKVNGYCSDMTRTVFFGRADEKFKKMYEVVRHAQQLPFDILRTSDSESRDSKRKKLSTSSKNITPENVDKAARNYIMKQGFPTVPHSVGHGVGLEVHELPHLSPGFDEKILPNTVFTIEPGIYLNVYGGVRIEDTAWFDGNEIVPLTKSSKNLIEIS